MDVLEVESCKSSVGICVAVLSFTARPGDGLKFSLSDSLEGLSWESLTGWIVSDAIKYSMLVYLVTLVAGDVEEESMYLLVSCKLEDMLLR